MLTHGPASAQTDLLTTKKASAPASSAPARAASPAATGTLTTTRAAAVALAPKPAEKPSAAIAPAPPTATPDSNLLSTKKISAPITSTATHALAPLTSADAPPTSTTAETKPAAAAPAPATAPANDSFIITARTPAGQTVLNFPYNKRTAAAVFERGRNIWIIFSQAADANVALLRTVLPSAIVDITQYNLPDTTVLRFTTDGTLHASAEQDKGNHGWNITLAASSRPAETDTTISVDHTDRGSRLLLSVFDVGPTLSFYDPKIGDRLFVVPTYDSGHGMSYARQYPEISFLATPQGIVAIARQDDMTSVTSRAGVIFESPHGLAVSDNLSTLKADNAPAPGVASSVLLPYDQWYVAPDKFRDTMAERIHALAYATKESRAPSLLSLATLYLGAGMGTEAYGYLALLKANEPTFYQSHKLALLSVAALALEQRIDEATTILNNTAELREVPEAELWREYLGLFTPQQSLADKAISGNDKPAAAVPPPPPSTADDDVAEGSNNNTAAAPTAPAVAPTTSNRPWMHFLKYYKTYIRYYPPRISQMITNDAADAYIANGLEEKAIAAYDTLNRDGILAQYTRRAEYAVALVNIKQNKLLDAQKILGKLLRQNEDLYILARARYTEALLQMQHGDLKPDEAADAIESIRLSWRGDGLERDMLRTLAKIYLDGKHYAPALRAMKDFTTAFPYDPDFLSVSTEMSNLFNDLYINGKSEEIPPLESLALFYEFRDLTPIGAQGDAIIQRLADRLASFDLIDRATQLLETQINFRLGGEQRSRVGARLALLYLLNHQPNEAQKVIEITNFGSNPPELQRQRLELSAQALSELGHYEEALSMLSYDTSPEGDLLKLDVLWAAKDWPNVINRGEDILAKRHDLTAPLTERETEVLLKLALGYSFTGDYTQLRYLRDYYTNLLPDNTYRPIFDFITNDTSPIDKTDLSNLTAQISHTESFLNLFKAKIAAGKLSEAVK